MEKKTLNNQASNKHPRNGFATKCSVFHLISALQKKHRFAVVDTARKSVPIVRQEAKKPWQMSKLLYTNFQRRDLWERSAFFSPAKVVVEFHCRKLKASRFPTHRQARDVYIRMCALARAHKKMENPQSVEVPSGANTRASSRATGSFFTPVPLLLLSALCISWRHFQKNSQALFLRDDMATRSKYFIAQVEEDIFLSYLLSSR